jgi:hypothetical protein
VWRKPLGLPSLQRQRNVPVTRAPVDIVLLSVNWDSRAALRAQLLEEGLEVVASDDWTTTRQLLRSGGRPRLVFVDLKDLPDADEVLDALHVLMKPGRVLVLTALASVPTSTVDRLGFRALHRPVTIEEVVGAISDALGPATR